MDTFFIFLAGEWVLFLLLALVLLLWLGYELHTGASAIDVAQLSTWVNRQGAKIVDVRESKRFAQGFIPGSVNMPAKELGARIKELAADKERPVVLVCDFGRESAATARRLKKEGLKNVCLLRGGVQEWLRRELPLQRQT